MKTRLAAGGLVSVGAYLLGGCPPPPYETETPISNAPYFVYDPRFYETPAIGFGRLGPGYAVPVSAFAGVSVGDTAFDPFGFTTFDTFGVAGVNVFDALATPYFDSFGVRGFQTFGDPGFDTFGASGFTGVGPAGFPVDEFGFRIPPVRELGLNELGVQTTLFGLN